jgi:hypothetical protein
VDPQALSALILTRQWWALTALFIGAGVRFLKSDSPLPSFLHVKPDARVWIALSGGVVAGVADQLSNHVAWPVALTWGLSAAGLAIVGHETMIESLRGGREFFEPRTPDRKPPTPGDPPATTKDV